MKLTPHWKDYITSKLLTFNKKVLNKTNWFFCTVSCPQVFFFNWLSVYVCVHYSCHKLNNFFFTIRPDFISPLDDLAFDMYQDPEIAGIIRKLEKKKQEAVLRKTFWSKKLFMTDTVLWYFPFICAFSLFCTYHVIILKFWFYL